jgi:hypothetical protein
MKRSFLLLPVFFFLLSCGEKPVEVKTDTVPAKPKKVASKFNEKDGLIFGVELVKGIKTPYEDAIGRVGDSLLISSFKGKVEKADTLGRTRRLLFDLKGKFLVDKIIIAPRAEGEWLVCWQETELLGMNSYAALYKTGSEKPEWKNRFEGANPGIPVIDGDAAYVTSKGIVAKINLSDGKIAWMHDSLFNPYKHTYQKFERPIVCANKIVFVDYPVRGKRERRDTLVVEPVTGERLK